MKAKPRIADVQCSRLQFQPGDRVLVRTTHKLDQNETKRLRKTIQKWAGVEVEVLIYSVLDMEIKVEQGERVPGLVQG